jgi:hypothetical protein
MHSYPFPPDEQTVYGTKLLHGEECMVTNRRIIVISPEEFHQVPLGDVSRVSGHVETYLPWVTWARFFPVHVYRESKGRFGPELVLECTTRDDMLALVDVIERGALLTDTERWVPSRKEPVINDTVQVSSRSHSGHNQRASSVHASAHHAA